ncbi:carboxypeptidase S [Meredithblackwellia eburnea MCA 4105]
MLSRQEMVEREEKRLLLPISESRERELLDNKLRPRYSRFLWLILVIFCLPAIPLLAPTWLPDSPEVAIAKSKASCPAQPQPRNIGLDWKPEEEEGYPTKAFERLRGAIQIPTQSYDDMGAPEEDERFMFVGELGSYLETVFPLLHEKLSVELIAKYGRLYTWAGSNPSLKPIVLMAHQDVVPVNPATVDQWTYPPFGGHQDEDGWIWGRGSADCKNTLIGILAAIEQLAVEDFQPERTIILSFGFDEEIGGRRSAKPLAEAIVSKYGEDSVLLIVDEGFTGVDQAYGTTFARLGMAEKGSFSIQLDVLTPGGHSSVPPRHTGIGILSLLLVELEKNPAKVNLVEGNPVLSYLNCAADFGDVDKKLQKRVKDPKAWKALGEELAEDPILRAFLGTTQAADLVTAGVKVNALPELSSAKVNYRIDFLESVESEFKRITSILEPVVSSLNLTFSVQGSHASVANNVVRLDIDGEGGLEPAPLTPSKGLAFDLMGSTVRHIWEDAVVAPSGMIANTDTKHYWSLTNNIYRFVPASLDLIKNFHTVDERIHIDAHLSSIRFFYKLIRNTEGLSDE